MKYLVGMVIYTYQLKNKIYKTNKKHHYGSFFDFYNIY